MKAVEEGGDTHPVKGFVKSQQMPKSLDEMSPLSFAGNDGQFREHGPAQYFCMLVYIPSISLCWKRLVHRKALFLDVIHETDSDVLNMKYYP